MLKRVIVLIAGLLALAAMGLAHDMFLIAAEHSVPPHQTIEIALYNGTFDESLNTIDRDRMTDVSVVHATGDIVRPSAESWRDQDEASWLSLETGPPGTLLVGVSTRPRVIELAADDFNEYLRHDGLLDALEARREAGILDRDAIERYSKHVKMILEVGGESSETWRHRLGYPVELVPLADPAAVEPGDSLDLLVLVRGEPVADQLVYASFEGHHAHADDGAHREAVTTRTDRDGVATIEISRPGRWYVRLIHMVAVEESGVDYESNWATLTFQVD